MAYTTKAAEHFCGGGATNEEIDHLFDFCSTFKGGGKKPVMRYIDFGQDCWDIDEHLIGRME